MSLYLLSCFSLLLLRPFLCECAHRTLLTQSCAPLQLLEESAGALPSSDLAIKQAAEWIFERAFGHLALPPRPEFGHLTTMDKSVVVGQVADVLHLIHDEKLEVFSYTMTISLFTSTYIGTQIDRQQP